MIDMPPEWWRDRLLNKLLQQGMAVESMEAWYVGEHPLPAASATNSELYRAFQRMAQTNLLCKVVGAVSDRLAITGIRLKDDSSDEAAWDIWRRSGMDMSHSMSMTTSLIAGVSHLSVWPNAQGRAIIAPEHPSEMVHELVPGSLREVAAAMKVYRDDVSERWVATLWLPDSVHMWSSASEAVAYATGWEEADSFSNPWGIVPVVPLPNRPSLRRTYMSEMHEGIPIQQRINQTLLNLLVAEESVAFPQRYATGLELDRDEDGNPTRPFKSGPDSLWVAEDPDVKFGQFNESRFDGYLQVLRSDIEGMSAATSTPLFNLSAHLAVPPSAEALNALESGLVKKVQEKQRIFGRSFEDAINIALRMEGNDVDEFGVEVAWADAHLTSEAAKADAAQKLSSIGVPTEALWEMVGASPQEIVRWRSMSMTDAFRNLVAQVGQQQADTTTTEQPMNDGVA